MAMKGDKMSYFTDVKAKVKSIAEKLIADNGDVYTGGISIMLAGIGKQFKRFEYRDLDSMAEKVASLICANEFL